MPTSIFGGAGGSSKLLIALAVLGVGVAVGVAVGVQPGTLVQLIAATTLIVMLLSLLYERIIFSFVTLLFSHYSTMFVRLERD